MQAAPKGSLAIALARKRHTEVASVCMQSTFFEWDDRKAELNLAKHGITFHQACAVFRDPLALTFPDEDHSVDEEREITFGCLSFDMVLVVSHTRRDERIRIISARRANRAERDNFHMRQPPDRIHDELNDDVRPHYDFDPSKGARGKYYNAVRKTVLMVPIEEDIARYFSTAEAVNAALRTFIAEGRAVPRTE
jgi:uncharacterized DUF497 family protein